MSAIPLALRQNTPEWEAARQSPDFIGASDVPIITGSAPASYGSPYELWAYKTGRLDRLPLDSETEELFALGHAVEPIIAAQFTKMSGIPLRRVNRTLRHPEIEWAVASLDRVSAHKGDRRIVEIKWDPWARFSRAVEGVPPHVLEQVQWQLMVRGKDWVAEVAVLQGSKVSRYEVEPDAQFQADLLFVVDAFRRDHLLTDTPPPIDGSEATRQALARLYPTDDGEMLERPTAELHALMSELAAAMPEAKAAEERVDKLKNGLRSALGEHAGCETDGWKVTYRTTKGRTTTDWQALAAHYRSMVTGVSADALDEIEQRHTSTGEGSRRLVPTWKAAKEEGSWT